VLTEKRISDLQLLEDFHYDSYHEVSVKEEVRRPGKKVSFHEKKHH